MNSVLPRAWASVFKRGKNTLLTHPSKALAPFLSFWLSADVCSTPLWPQSPLIWSQWWPEWLKQALPNCILNEETKEKISEFSLTGYPASHTHIHTHWLMYPLRTKTLDWLPRAGTLTSLYNHYPGKQPRSPSVVAWGDILNYQAKVKGRWLTAFWEKYVLILKIPKSTFYIIFHEKKSILCCMTICHG